MKFLILLTLSFFSITSAWAKGTCEGLFSASTIEISFTQTIANLARKNVLNGTNGPQHLKNIKNLSLKLFELNRESLLEEARNSLLASSRGDHRFLDPALTYDVLKKELESGSIVFSIKAEKIEITSPRVPSQLFSQPRRNHFLPDSYEWHRGILRLQLSVSFL